MRKATFYGCFALVMVGMVLGLGCPQQGGDRPATFAVTGTVTQGGNPVDGATVTFVPTGSGQSAVGTTDGSGKYTLTTFASGDGAAPGQYGVKIVKYEGGETDVAAGGGGEGAEGEMPADYAGAVEDDAASAPVNLLPAKYETPQSSGLTATVTDDASQNVFAFAIEGGESAKPGESGGSE